MNYPALLGALLALLLSSCATDKAPIYDLLVTNVTVIDAAGGARMGQSVAVTGDRIAAVGAAGTIPGRAQRSIDGSNRYLIPGLWDMHVHVTYEAALTDAMADLFLDYGVTSVRDTGGLLPELTPVVSRWRAAGADAPRIYFSGPLLDGSKVVYDGDDRPEIGTANPDIAAARRNIEALIAADVDFIKIYELVSPDVFAALASMARENGLPIAAHVPLSLTADSAGPQVDSMEHLRNIELACSNQAESLRALRTALLSDSGDLSGFALRSKLHAEQRPVALADVALDSPRCQAVIAALRNTIQVPTLRLSTIFEYSPVARADWTAALADLPPALAAEWLATAQRFAGQGSEHAIRVSQWSLALAAALHAGDVPVGAGTDTPIGQAVPGYSLHTELERLVQAGLSPLEALRAATVRPAEFFKLEQQMGLVAAGMAADLVLLRANPLDNIANTRAIDVVISKGQVVRE